MRAIQFSQFGQPLDVLNLIDLPLPEPRPGQIRLRFTHRPINPSDFATIKGEYGRLPKLPAVPGLEGMGTIAALGAGVAGLQIGRRVIPFGIRGGSWAEYGLANADLVLPVPDELSDQTAAQFLGNPVSAWMMLEDELDLQAGDWVLQTAAGSTLGRLVLQIAQLQGYKTVNFVRRREQVQELLDLGADAVICTQDVDVVAQVKALTGGKGVKGALEAVGGQTGALAVSCLAPGATMIVYGSLSGEPIPLHSGEILFRGNTVRGFWLTYRLRTTPPAELMPVLARLMQLMTTGQIVPPVEAEYDLADFKKAVVHADTPGRSGKVILIG